MQRGFEGQQSHRGILRHIAERVMRERGLEPDFAPAIEVLGEVHFAHLNQSVLR